VGIVSGDCGSFLATLIFDKECGLALRDRFIACSDAQKASESVILGVQLHELLP